jgi:glutathione synthase/RimK-type ligase-like ATP-grasp enzyme
MRRARGAIQPWKGWSVVARAFSPGRGIGTFARNERTEVIEVTAIVGVLCTRVRVEEKQILATLADAGVPALPLAPTSSPLPMYPVPPKPSFATAKDGAAAEVVIDRCQNRAVAAALLPLLRAKCVTVIDAGLAATMDRLAVAMTLTSAGIPRPLTDLVCGDEAALAALDISGYPATFLPLAPGAKEIVLLDQDTGEAVFEHREVLGGKGDVIGLLQTGIALAADRVTVIVVGGEAIAVDSHDHTVPPVAYGLAERAAHALGASLIGVELAHMEAGPVVWGVQAVPDFRHALPIGDITVAEALAKLATVHIKPDAVQLEIQVGTIEREVTNDVALTA